MLTYCDRCGFPNAWGFLVCVFCGGRGFETRTPPPTPAVSPVQQAAVRAQLAQAIARGRRARPGEGSFDD